MADLAHEDFMDRLMGFRRDINGLRAIAVLAVLLFHFNIPALQGGFVGVDIFFVISGFLMTEIIIKRIDQRSFSLFDFYLARCRRIIPALAFLCLMLLCLGWLYLIPLDYRQLGKQVAGSISFVSNIIFWREADYFDSDAHEKWLLHTWSLSAEWQFYMLYPLILVLLKKWLGTSTTGIVLIVFTLLSFSASMYLGPHRPMTTFYFLPTRVWEMLVGALVCLRPLTIDTRWSIWLQWGGLGLILASILGLHSTKIWPSWFAIMPILGTVMVIYSADNNALISRNIVVQSVGNASYSIYLWHWPFVVFLNYASQTLQTPTIQQPLWIIASIVAALVTGYASYLFIEQPMRKVTVIPSNRHLNIIPYALVVSAVFGTGLMVFINNGFNQRVNSQTLVASQESKNINPTRSQCLVTKGTTSPSCITKGGSNTIAAIVIGDSHADALLNAVARAANPTGSTLFLGYSGCLTIPNIQFRIKREGYQCGDFVSRQFEQLKHQYLGIPIIVINRTSFYIYGHNESKETTIGPLVYFDKESTTFDDQYQITFKAKYVAAMCELAKHRPVYITEPIPEMGLNVPVVLARRIMTYGRSTDIFIRESDYEQRNRFTLEVMQAAVKTCGVSLLDPRPYLCTDDKCLGSRAGRPLYYDDDHLSEYGNRLLEPMFQKIWDKKSS